MKKILLASNNNLKIREIKFFFKKNKIRDVKIVTPKELGIESPEETEDTFYENSQLKAKYYAEKSGLPSIADDSGFCVPELNDLPGVHTADWAGKERDFGKAIKRLEEELVKAGIKTKKIRAKAYCVHSYCNPKTNSIISFHGDMKGHIDFRYRDLEDAVGFLRVFVPQKRKKNFTLLSLNDTYRISHRAKAFKLLLKHVKCL